MSEILTIISILIALFSVFYAHRANQISKESMGLSREANEIAQEGIRTARELAQPKIIATLAEHIKRVIPLGDMRLHSSPGNPICHQHYKFVAGRPSDVKNIIWWEYTELIAIDVTNIGGNATTIVDATGLADVHFDDCMRAIWLVEFFNEAADYEDEISSYEAMARTSDRYHIMVGSPDPFGWAVPLRPPIPLAAGETRRLAMHIRVRYSISDLCSYDDIDLAFTKPYIIEHSGDYSHIDDVDQFTFEGGMLRLIFSDGTITNVNIPVYLRDVEAMLRQRAPIDRETYFRSEIPLCGENWPYY